jgi:hypothetical protein
MRSTDTAPEQLSERELFTEYIELLEQDTPADGYTKTKLAERRASLLAEIGERLEALEAAKALLYNTHTENTRNHGTDDEQVDDSTEVASSDG